MFKYLSNLFKEWLIQLGLSEHTAKIFEDYAGLIIIIFLSFIVYFLVKKILIKIVHAFVKKSKNKWDDVLIKRKVLTRISYLIPLLIINFFSPYLLSDYPITINIFQKTLQILMVAVSVSAISSFLNALHHIYQNFEISKSKPIKGYLQVAKIILYTFAIVLVISILLGESSFGWLAGFGAFSAILMLVFKDPILGFVGGIQLTSNNMVKIGDWIAMHKYGADGTVIDISLTSVKVQNWDKTITTIPTYAMVTDYFQNWRGMEESGGRRIKRSINIDMESVKFCTPEMLKRFRKFQFVSDYIDNKNKEIEEYNAKYNIDNSVLVNGRRQTNLGIFRAYLKAYLHHDLKISDTMTFLVRQLQPTEYGIPVQIYVFSKIQEWAKYEDIQSDIFDHVISVVPQFDLRIFQSPTGADFKKLF